MTQINNNISNSTSSNSSSNNSNNKNEYNHDIFLSYEYGNTAQVIKLYDKLTKTYELKTWLDIKSLKIGDDLSEKILKAIKACKILICCMTKNYSQTRYCQKELVVADNLNKKIIVLMFENQRLQDLGKIGLIMDKFIRINIFKDADALEHWCGNLASALFVTIETMLGIDLSHKIDQENAIYKRAIKSSNHNNATSSNTNINTNGINKAIKETKSYNIEKKRPQIQKNINGTNKQQPNATIKQEEHVEQLNNVKKE